MTAWQTGVQPCSYDMDTECERNGDNSQSFYNLAVFQTSVFSLQYIVTYNQV